MLCSAPWSTFNERVEKLGHIQKKVTGVVCVCLSVSFVGLELEQKTGNGRRDFLEPGADVRRGPAVRGELRGRRLVPTCQTLERRLLQ